MKHKPKLYTLWTRTNLKKGCVVYITGITFGSHQSNKNKLYVKFAIGYNGKIISGYSRELSDWFKLSTPYETQT